MDRLRTKYLILAFMAIFHLFSIFLPPDANNIYLLIIRPLVYITGLVVFLSLKLHHDTTELKGYDSIILAICSAIIYYFALFICILIFGAGANATTPSFNVWLNNIWVYVPFVIAQEYFRVYLVKTSKQYTFNQRAVLYSVIVVVFTFIRAETLSSFIGYATQQRVDYIITSVMPNLILNIILIPIASYSVPLGCIILNIIFTLTSILSPILPNVKRILWAIVIYLSLFVIYFLYNKFLFTPRIMRRKSRARRHGMRWEVKHPIRSSVISLSIILLVVLFATKSLPYFPAAVASNSMKPAISRGALVFIKKINPKKIEGYVQVGDVIDYSKGKTEVIHRVIEITGNENGETLYITKGDNNPKADTEPVTKDKILGIASAHIPLIGYPTIMLQQF